MAYARGSLVVLSLLSAAVASAGEEPAVSAVVANLNRAIQAKDEALARAQFTADAWSRQQPVSGRRVQQPSDRFVTKSRTRK